MASHVPSSLFPKTKNLRLARKIVRKLGAKRRDHRNPATVGEIEGWLVNQPKRTRLESILRTLIQSNKTPVKGSVSNDSIYLSKSYFLNPRDAYYGS